MSAQNEASAETIFSELEGEPGMRELLEGFVARLRDTGCALPAMRDPAEIEHVARRLRAAAGSYGFPAISSAAGAVEGAIRAWVGVPAAVAHLASLCRRAGLRRRIVRAA